MTDESDGSKIHNLGKLETTSKIVDIVFKGLIASFIGGATLYVTFNKTTLENYQSCKEIEQHLLKFVSENEKNSVTEKLVESRLATIPSSCHPTDPVFVQHLLNSWKSLKVAESAMTSMAQAEDADVAKHLLQGWVPFGRKVNEKFSDRNFDVINEANRFAPGEIWRARWPVSVRQANRFSLLDGFSQKQVIGQILPGQCWKATTLDSGNLLYWSRGEVVACPN